MSVIEVAKELGISRQRVMAIESAALRKLRVAFLSNGKIEDWLELLNTVKNSEEDNIIYFI